MATTSTFSDLCNQYLPDKIFKTDFLKRDYVLNTIEKKDDWKSNASGSHIVPFLEARPSSLSFGSLTDASDIAESEPVRGTESQQEVWGTMKLNQKDLDVHQNGKIPVDTFLKLIPDEYEGLMRTFKDAVSGALINGPVISLVTDSTSAASGIMIVDHPERFQKGMKVLLDDDDTGSTATCYVTAINMNTNAITISDSRGGTAWNASAYTAAQNAKFYWPGAHSGTAVQNSFNSIKGMLLSNANGGDAAIHGKTKTTYQTLQALNILGSSITASNIVEEIFDAYTDVRAKCRGNSHEILCSYKHLGSILKVLQTEKGAYQVTKAPDASQYGWTKVTIADLATGMPLNVVAAPECNDSEIYFIDWASMYFASNGFFKKRKAPDGKEYYEVRATTGYYYLIDVSLTGNLICKAPSHNAVLYSVSY